MSCYASERAHSVLHFPNVSDQGAFLSENPRGVPGKLLWEMLLSLVKLTGTFQSMNIYEEPTIC